MPKQELYKKQPNKKPKIVLLIFILLVAMLGLGIVSKIIINNVIEQQKIKEQRLTLDQTLKDITILYDKFAASNDYPKILTQQPKNECSEISSVYINKSYTCGTRASIEYTDANEEQFNLINKKLYHTLDKQKFELKHKDDIQKDVLDNGLTSYAKFTNSDSSECIVIGTLYKDKKAFTTSDNSLRYLFFCNINTSHQLFDLED